MKIYLYAILIVLSLSKTAYADVMLQDINGTSISLNALKGNWVLVNVWASWCEPCLDEIPALNSLHQQYHNKHIRVFGVNYDALTAREQKMLATELNIKFPLLKASSTHALKLGDVPAVPMTAVFNPAGKLVKKMYGGQTLKAFLAATRTN